MSYLNWKVPSSWVWAESLDVCESVRDGTHDTPHYVNNGVPLVTSKNLIDGKICFKNVKFISIKDHDEIEKRSAVETGDVLIAMIGTIGNPVVVEKKFDFSIKNVGLFKKNEEVICPDYFKYWLDSSFFINWLKPRLRGTTQKFASLGLLRELPVPLAPVKEQHRIVAKVEELFSELDKGIESLKKAREQLKVYRQAVLKHAFEGKLTEKWREENKDKLDTADQLLARIQKEREARYQQQLNEWKKEVEIWEGIAKDGRKPAKPKQIKVIKLLSDKELSKLPLLPNGYIYTRLENLGELGRGKSKHRPRNDPQLFGGEYPFIQTAEVKAANRVIQSYTQTYNETGLAQSKLWPKGTLCITIAANIAETAFLGFEGCFPDSVVGFSAFKNAVLPEYVELFIKAVRVRIEAYAPATAQKNINLTTLENLIVPLCLIDEQQSLVNRLEGIFSAIDENEREINLNLQRAEILRQSILKKAFSGQLVEQDPNDEPASILLERIKAEKEKQIKSVPKKKRAKKRKTAA